jgi:N-acetylglucosaminyldiphosphoundecaprenol N-acetyl-beta-D-mannosaminyltransferase
LGDFSHRILTVAVTACLALVAHSGAQAASFNPPQFSTSGSSKGIFSLGPSKPLKHADNTTFNPSHKKKANHKGPDGNPSSPGSIIEGALGGGLPNTDTGGWTSPPQWFAEHPFELNTDVELFDREEVAILANPLPEALPLMGSVLTGWFLLVYWRRRRAQNAESSEFQQFAYQRSTVAPHAAVDDGEAAALRHAHDDLSRPVYSVLGIPIDAMDMAETLRLIKEAATGKAAYLISTANLNFLVNSHEDRDFRKSLLASDLCVADGIAVVWVARLLGIPIKERITGADIFAALKSEYYAERPLHVCLFGGDAGIAVKASTQLNSQQTGLKCISAIDPGSGTAGELSRDDLINTINASDAQLLGISLGAKKGQSWLMRNHARLRIPVRLHFGAVMNFEAGSVRRAPQVLRGLGLEWLWRIKEEPYLWTRYWHDGMILLSLLLTRVVPLALGNLHQVLTGFVFDHPLHISQTQDRESITIRLSGIASARTVDEAATCFQRALRSDKPITLDCSNLRFLDPRFLGLLIMLRKQLRQHGLGLQLSRVTPRIARIFHLNGLEAFVPAHSEEIASNEAPQGSTVETAASANWNWSGANLSIVSEDCPIPISR